MHNLLKQINNFIYICTKGILLENFKESSINPIFSVIIPLFNSEETIKTAVRSIQNQNENNFEIIIVEDCSKDNSINVIKKMQNEDSRIKIIINKKNKGALFSKSIGALNSKGKYIFFLDSDDLFINANLFKIIYQHIGKGIDIVEFSGFASENKYLNINQFPKVPKYLQYKQNNEIVRQPRLSKYIYQKKNNKIIRLIDGFLWGKCINVETYKNTLRYLGKWIFEEKVNYGDDRIINFALFRVANSFKFIEEYGLIYYYKNPSSLTNRINDIEKSHDELINIMFLFNLTKISGESEIVLFEINFRWKLIIRPGLNEENKRYARNIFHQILKCRYINYRNKIKIFIYLTELE